MILKSSIARFAGLSLGKRLTLLELLAIKRERDQLSRMDKAALRDLGLTQHDVSQEVARSFWDVPRR